MCGGGAPEPRMQVFDKIISDRGSRYAVAGGPAATRAEAQALLAELKRNKRFAKATHNSWAAILADGPVKDDDGEAGAGALILQMLERAELRDHVVIVPRWFGGKQLGGARIRHGADAGRLYQRVTGRG